MTSSIVSLRDVSSADLPMFFEHQLDPDAACMAGFASRQRQAFMEHWAKILDNENVIRKTILLGGHVAGNIVSFQQGGRRQVGYWIGREHWGKGVATRALGEFLAHERRRPLYAFVASHNVASIRVLEKCGFTLSVGDEAPPGQHEQEAGEILMELSA